MSTEINRSIRLNSIDQTTLNRLKNASGEVFYDATNNTLRVYNGTTSGGAKLATQAWVNANAITLSALTTALIPYATTSALNSGLSGKVSQSSLTSTLSSYVTSSSLTSALSSYATTASLSSYASLSNSTTLSPTITTSSLTSVGTLTSLTVNSSGTITGIAHEGSTNSAAVGYIGVPLVNLSYSTTRKLMLTDQGKQIYLPGGTSSTIQVPSHNEIDFPIGSTIKIVCGVDATATITPISYGGYSADTLILSPDESTGTRTLGSCGIATLLKVALGVWYISGTALT